VKSIVIVGIVNYSLAELKQFIVIMRYTREGREKENKEIDNDNVEKQNKNDRGKIKKCDE